MSDDALTEILQRVWGAAVDACSSPDFRDADGVLNEEAYLRYQRNVFAQAASAIQEVSRSGQ